MKKGIFGRGDSVIFFELQGISFCGQYYSHFLKIMERNLEFTGRDFCSCCAFQIGNKDQYHRMINTGLEVISCGGHMCPLRIRKYFFGSYYELGREGKFIPILFHCGHWASFLPILWRVGWHGYDLFLMIPRIP